jgi:hypothetical protein
MDKLGYLSTFVSLILGLGVANVLAQFSRLVKLRGGVRWYWVHTLWGAFLLLAMAGEWWILLQWRGVEAINFFVYLTFLVKPAVLFFVSDLLFPEPGAATGLDLRAHYYSVHRQASLVGAIYPIADAVDTLLKGRAHFIELGAIYPVTLLLILTGCIVAAYTRNPKFHAAWVLIAYCGLVAGITNALIAV